VGLAGVGVASGVDFGQMPDGGEGGEVQRSLWGDRSRARSWAAEGKRAERFGYARSEENDPGSREEAWAITSRTVVSDEGRLLAAAHTYNSGSRAG
jgi:hypothetical protein